MNRFVTFFLLSSGPNEARLTGGCFPQERLHYLDPVQAPQVTIPVAHLRDDILASELSPASRQRLWSKVEKIVEGNANVRAGEDEVNGEVWRVWQWVGLVGALSSS